MGTTAVTTVAGMTVGTMAESRGRGARWSAAALAAPVAAGLFAGTTAWSQHHNPLASAAEPTLTPVTPSPTTDAELAALKQRLAVTSAAIDRLARQVKAVKARAAALESGGSPSASASASRTLPRARRPLPRAGRPSRQHTYGARHDDVAHDHALDVDGRHQVGPGRSAQEEGARARSHQACTRAQAEARTRTCTRTDSGALPARRDRRIGDRVTSPSIAWSVARTSGHGGATSFAGLPAVLPTDLVERFRAMACDITFRVVAPTSSARGCVAAGRKVFEDVERACTRFDPTSPLMRANADPEAWHDVPEVLASAVREARLAHEETGGLFDPRVLKTLESWGYDRSLPSASGEVATARTAAGDFAHPYAPWRPGVRDSSVLLGPEPIDLGGIGKGLAVRWAAASSRRPASAVLVEAGGDCYLPGAGPGGRRVADRRRGPVGRRRTGRRARLVDRACATSSIRLRRWRAGGEQVHHLIDPRTGRPGGRRAAGGHGGRRRPGPGRGVEQVALPQRSRGHRGAGRRVRASRPCGSPRTASWPPQRRWMSSSSGRATVVEHQLVRLTAVEADEAGPVQDTRWSDEAS